MGREIGEHVDLSLEILRDLFIGRESQPDAMIGFRQHGQDLVALGGGERLGDSAGHDPPRMDALVAKQFDDVLPEPP